MCPVEPCCGAWRVPASWGRWAWLGVAGSLLTGGPSARASDTGFSPDVGPSGIPPGLAIPPFMLGVASGDPLPDSVVLWTRLVRDPFDAASMGEVAVPVAWDGYGLERARLLSSIADAGISNPVVLSGDMHQTWVNDLRVDFSRPETPAVAAEFVCPSISSEAGGPDPIRRDRSYLAENPHVHLVDSARRGYLRCVVGRKRWETLPMYVEDASVPVSEARPGRAFTVRAGRSGIET